MEYLPVFAGVLVIIIVLAIYTGPRGPRGA